MNRARPSSFPVMLTLLSVFLLSYGAATAQQNVEAEIKRLGDFFKIYLINEDRRGPEDYVLSKKNRDGSYSAEISYWRNLASRDPAEEICAAYRWLLFGRGEYGKGARAAFEKYPYLFQINIKLYDMEFGTMVGKKKAEILPTQKVVPYLRIGVTRNSFLKKEVPENSVKKNLEKGKCAQVGKEYFDLVWMDEGYIRQAK